MPDTDRDPLDELRQLRDWLAAKHPVAHGPYGRESVYKRTVDAGSLERCKVWVDAAIAAWGKERADSQAESDGISDLLLALRAEVLKVAEEMEALAAELKKERDELAASRPNQFAPHHWYDPRNEVIDALEARAARLRKAAE